MSEFEIKDFKAEVLDRGILNSDRQPAHTATIQFSNGDWVSISRYHDESGWVADAAFRANGFPVFSNGTGTRCGVGRCLTDDEIIRTLNIAASKHILDK